MARKTTRVRAAREPEEAARVGIGFRVTPSLKTKIEAACAKSGRSQSQEIELRLERSFGYEGLRLVRGEQEARVVLHNGKLLVVGLGLDSPDVPTELDIRGDDLELLLDFFNMPVEK